jgi:hypothetical protein
MAIQLSATSDIITLNSDVSGLTLDVNQNTVDIVNLSGQHSADTIVLSGVIDNNSSDIVSLSSAIDAIDEGPTNIAYLSGVINTNITDIATLSSDISQLYSQDSYLSGRIDQIGGGGSSGGGSGIWILDITPTTIGNVGDKAYLAGGSNVLTNCSSDADDLTVSVLATLGTTDTKPTATVNGQNVSFGGSHASTGSSNSLFTGSANISLPGGGNVVALHEDGTSVSAVVATDTPPVITALNFTGGYPGSQSELKENDTFQIFVQADLAFTSIEVDDIEACKSQTTGVASTTSTTFTATIADRGTSNVARPARVRVRKASGTYSDWLYTNDGGGTANGDDLVNCNNLYPSVDLIIQGGITYPATQSAIKDFETVTIHSTVTDFDTITYSSPNGDLSIPNVNTYQENKALVACTSPGNYNVSTPNYQIVATKTANDAVTSESGVVFVADIQATLTVTEPATRLRSGGNDGTAVQPYAITITSDQDLSNAPTLVAGSEGTFTGGGFTGGPTVWTRTFQVHDDDTKGSYAWGSIAATNLAGILTNTITGDSNYTLGGFVSRGITLAAFANTADMNVEATTYANVALSWSVKSLPNKRAVGTVATPDANSWALDTLNTNPTTIRILDTAATGSSSSPTTITIEETV